MSEWSPQKLLRAVQKQNANPLREVVYNSPEGIQKRYAKDYLNSKAPIINLENEREQMAPPRDDLLEHLKESRALRFAEHHTTGFRTPAQVVHVALQEPEPVSAPRKPYYEMWGLVKATGLFMSLGLLLGGVFMYGMSTIR